LVGLGHKNVRTLLNSGNVLFQCTRPKMFARRAGETVTTRNWATVLKLQAASNGHA
jgi:uncharacterized protein (DUF1697 family)